ncbi:MAG: hypothetical protein QJR06_05255 [Alicyclobacillaceae bacterium]|nr:hypothetical protein [Alicyclobacillaceae bacterium]
MISASGILHAVLALVFLGFSLFLAGNAAVSVCAAAVGAIRKDRRSIRIAQRIVRVASVREWKAIGLGVVPPVLIGIQIRLADPSTYLLTKGWLMVVFFLFGGWAALYGYKILLYKYPQNPSRFLPAGVLAVLLLLPAAPSFVVTDDFASKPELFGGTETLLRALVHPPVATRALHLAATGLLLGGLTVCATAYRPLRRLPEGVPGRGFYVRANRFGLRWIFAVLAGQAVIGSATLFTLSPEARSALSGGAAGGPLLLAAGIALTALAAGAALFFLLSGRTAGLLGTLGVLVIAVLLVMGTIRLQVKPYQNGPYFGEVPPHLIPVVLQQPRCGW